MILEDKSTVLGIDEAGRGSVIGPLVMGCVIMPRDKLRFLKRIGVNDSKKLTSNKRKIVSRKIKKIAQFDTRIITAQQIDQQRLNGTNLNQIETNAMFDLIKTHKPDLCCIDCIDVNETRFHDLIQQIDPNMQVITEHKADETYDIVSAASIIAKTTRDREVEIIRQEYGRLGSGYPSDQTTINYLKTIENGEYPDFVRKTWTTIENIENEKNQ
ncbi:ribonuclease HII [Methanosphaera cuniculi]|uniref:ribonuclease HII n=1 Tax=Methanosphaera cuniculi TaxID=1077256 RepID=UPI0026F0860F|nr:ribonuclease HII [Methanosphaera cuniculi]